MRSSGGQFSWIDLSSDQSSPHPLSLSSPFLPRSPRALSLPPVLYPSSQTCLARGPPMASNGTRTRPPRPWAPLRNHNIPSVARHAELRQRQEAQRAIVALAAKLLCQCGGARLTVAMLGALFTSLASGHWPHDGYLRTFLRDAPLALPGAATPRWPPRVLVLLLGLARHAARHGEGEGGGEE